MSIHLVNTFLLMAFLTLTAWWGSGAKSITIRKQGLVSWSLGLALVGTLILAVSGAVAALGDTLFPSDSLASGLRQDFSTGAHFLIQLRLLHPVLAVIVGVIVLVVAGLTNLLRPGAWVRRSMLWVTGLVVVQLCSG